MDEIFKEMEMLEKKSKENREPDFELLSEQGARRHSPKSPKSKQLSHENVLVLVISLQ